MIARHVAGPGRGWVRSTLPERRSGAIRSAGGPDRLCADRLAGPRRLIGKMHLMCADAGHRSALRRNTELIPTLNRRRKTADLTA